jgi:hypothetical protein
MEQAMRHDLALARELGDRGGRMGPSGRVVRRVSLKAVMNAVNTEGREVLSADAEGYWKDQDRRYGFGVAGERRVMSVRVPRNRFGRARERIVYG